MAYTQPAFMVAHPLSELALSAFSLVAATGLSDDSKRALGDSRQGELAQYTASGPDAGFIVDFSAVFTTFIVNRCVIPAGHTYDTYRLQLFSDDNIGFASAITQFDINPITGAGVIDQAMATPTTTELFWLLRAPGSIAADVFSLGELWLGERVALSAADVQPLFKQDYTRNVATDVIGGRDVALELTPPRKQFTLGIRYVEPGSADWDILEEVLRLGRTTPFWYWPPDSTDPGPYLVKLDAEGSRAQENVVPRSGIHYSVRLSMTEQTS